MKGYLLPIPGDRRIIIYRVEKRARQSLESKEFYGDKWETKLAWELEVNTTDDIHSLLERFKDNDIHEFRIRKMPPVKDSA